jgi:RimJ/RimL family protein N-acetyltransferase
LSEIALEPWGEGDLPLLERLLGDPVMTEHLGGPESPEKLVERQDRYEKLPSTGTGEMFKIVDVETGLPVGSVGYWDRGPDAYETGWSVVPEFQGRGIATLATAQVIERLKAAQTRRFLWAYPSVDNHASNAICRKLGFELVETEEFEYPKDSGNIMRCNNWRLDLHARQA